VTVTAALRSCPDCEQGKHPNCGGDTWDNDADDFAPNNLNPVSRPVKVVTP
jgi:hypothetical protein